VIRIALVKLQLTTIGSAAAVVFYLLNGYSAANIGSNVVLAYLFVPICPYASFSFIERQTRRRFVYLTFSLAAFLSFTFLPTTVVAMLAMGGCAIGYVLTRHWGKAGLARTAQSVVPGAFARDHIGR
jgi:hypothetical protein